MIAAGRAPRPKPGGSIGPLGPPTRELRHPDDATIRAVYREQVDGLLEGVVMRESIGDLIRARTGGTATARADGDPA